MIPGKTDIQMPFNVNGGEQKEFRWLHINPKIVNLDIDSRKGRKQYLLQFHQFHPISAPPFHSHAILNRLLAICLMKDL